MADSIMGSPSASETTQPERADLRWPHKLRHLLVQVLCFDDLLREDAQAFSILKRAHLDPLEGPRRRGLLAAQLARVAYIGRDPKRGAPPRARRPAASSQQRAYNEALCQRVFRDKLRRSAAARAAESAPGPAPAAPDAAAPLVTAPRVSTTSRTDSTAGGPR